MNLTAGTRLGPYEILSAIGAGGMGEVYRARDTRLDRIVAIKVLPSHVSGDPALRERFEREARAIAALNHPHICTLHDVGRHEATDYLVLEYLEGQTLADRLTKSALPLDQTLAIAIQIADALDKAHRAGIVHRDLKPGNVMLTKSGAKLLDFGLAKMTPAVVAASGLSMAPTGVTPMTARGTILGTLQYMAPEQVEGREADARSDIFTFGAMVYEMVTGQRAFQGKSQASVIAAILEREPPVMSSLQPLSPRALDHIISKCLAKDPEDRWQSAADVRSELKSVAEGTAEGTDRTASSTRSVGRTVWALSAVAVLAIAALAVVSTLYLRRAVPAAVVTRLDVVTPPTTNAFSFALSLDGRLLAFVADGERGSRLWLRPLDQVKAQPLAGTEGADYPFWAPDGHALGFFADGKLKRVDLTGGAVEVLADAPLGRGGTWSPDGVIVFAPFTNAALMRVAATGGSVAPVTRLAPGQGSHRWPQFLPDGHRFLFSMATGQPETHGVYVGSLDGGEASRGLQAEPAAEYAAPGYLLLVSQGLLAAYPFDAARATVRGEPTAVAQAVGTNDGAFRGAFSVSAAGVLAHRAGAGSRRQLIWADRTGKMLGAIGPTDENAPSNPELAPDGKQVGVTRIVQGNNDAWLIEVSRGVAGRFTFDVGNDGAPLWSPDGSQIVFRSSRKGAYDLFEKAARGGADEQPLFVTSQNKSPLDWSRDGRFLLYSVQDPKSASDLWVLPMTGERQPFPVLQSSFDEIEGQFSPDGRWLAYVSNESGRYEIYIRTFPETGGKFQVSVAGGVQPRWQRDGHELYYLAPDSRLMAVPIRPAPEAHTLEAGAPVALFPTRLATGGNIATSGFLARAQYAVAADGRFLMNGSADEGGTSPITIVQNWDAALKK